MTTTMRILVLLSLALALLGGACKRAQEKKAADHPHKAPPPEAHPHELQAPAGLRTK